MTVSRPPSALLRPFVKLLWAADPSPAGAGATPMREHVLPTGDMHLAFRLSGPGLRVFVNAGDTRGHVLGHALVGGARTAHYAREAGVPGRSAGAQLRPGACWPLFGVPACALAGTHTPLELLWGTQAGQALDDLDEAQDAHRRIDALEQLLSRRLLGARGLPLPIATGLAALRSGASVGDAVARSGASHRHFIALFRESTGMTPRAYTRLLRFRRALRGLADGGEPSLALLAHEAGYADQPHLQRDFLAMAGLTPGQWRLAAPSHPNHVRVG